MTLLLYKLVLLIELGGFFAPGLQGIPAGVNFPQVIESDTASTEAIPIEAVSDTSLAQRLRTVFSNIDEFDSVRVTVREGVVRLSGSVLQPEAIENAEQLASRFEGVIYVDNDIESETDVGLRLNPTVERAREYLETAAAYLPLLVVAFLILLIFGLFSFLIGRLELPARKLGMNPLVWGLIRRILRGAFFLIGLLLAFDVLGITTLVGAVLGTAGVLGLALGFAFQDIVENYLAGMLLSVRRPFAINDLIRIGEHEGRVVRLTSRDLLLLSLEGNHIRLPNSTVFKSILINYTRNPRRLISFDVGLGVNEDISKAMEIGNSTLAAMNGILEDPPPFARVQSLAESTVVVRYHSWVDQRHADYFKVKSEAIRLVKAALDQAEIQMPEPIYRVRLQQLPEEDLDRVFIPSTPASLQAKNIDVTPDGKLEQQVGEDLASSDEKNLLQR